MSSISSSSTEFLLLQNDVSHLWDAFNWVVGGIGVITVFIIILLGILQYVLDKRFIKQELRKTRDDLDSKRDQIVKDADAKIKKENDAVFEQLINELSVAKEEFKKQLADKEVELNQKIEESKIQIFKTKNEVTGEIARSFAIMNEKDGSLAISANWALRSASSYVLAKSNEEATNSMLGLALTLVRKIATDTMPFEVEFLFERADQNEEYLKIMEPTKGEKVRRIREEIGEKLSN